MPYHLYITRSIENLSYPALYVGLGALILLGPLYLFTLLVYRLYFHPLAQYPGPLLARITDWYAVYHAYKGDQHLQHLWAHQKYGSRVRMAPNMIVINDPEAIKDIYGIHKNVQKAFFYQPEIDHGGSANLFNCRDREVHSQMRRFTAPAFSEASLSSMEVLIHPYIDKAFEVGGGEGMYEDAGKSWTADIAKWGNYITFDVMGNLVFGKDFGMVAGKANRELPSVIDAAVHRQLIAGSSRLLHKWRLDELLFPRLVRHGSKLRVYAKQEAMTRMDAEKADSGRKDVLWQMKDAKKKDGTPGFQDERIVVANARGLIIGGSDTTATQIAATMFYLTNYPRVLKILSNEIRETFKTFEEVRLGAKMNTCKYLHAVVSETLRISPSLPGIFPRQVLAGGLTVLGEFFPPGVELSMSVYSLQHNEDTYFLPHQFVPERWLPEQTSADAVKKCQDALMTFSYGSRTCIGKRLALMELYLVLAKVVWMYDLEYVCGGKDDRFVDDLNILEYKLLDHLAAGREGPVIRFLRRDGM